jgi:acetoacetyl-CoA synthetase
MRESRVTDGTLLWEPTEDSTATTGIARYLGWLRTEKHREFADYASLWEWSVSDLEGFWGSLWEYFGVIAHAPYEAVLGSRAMPGATWFPGATLNYAEHALRRRDDRPAVIAASEVGEVTQMTFAELHDQVAAVATGLRRRGVGRGDRVAALLPNIPETLVAFLATASLGAVWSSCAPEFGVGSVVHRFSQIEPKVLIACDGYLFAGRRHDRLPRLTEIVAQLPTVETTVVVARLDQTDQTPAGTTSWEELTRETGPLVFEPVPFDHPLWILYSSGTTGLPKPIVQSQGGILLEHLKELALHVDVGEGDRFFWYTSTAWMMWNLLISSLLVGTTMVLYDGSPGYPDLSVLWELAEGQRVTHFGVSPPFLQACGRAGLHPGRRFDLSSIRQVGSTGAPLTPDGFAWVYEEVGSDILLASISGGSDLCTAFLGGCPILPVRAGRIQCSQLGAKIEAYDLNGVSVVGEVGELVITAPMPSMPIYFWNDPDGERYRSSYFDTYPGVWRHGDWITVHADGSSVVHGRSDSTLNRGGVRMGTSEFYQVIDGLPEILDSVVIDTGGLGREGRLLLFVVPATGVQIEEALEQRIRDALRTELSPRHVPDEIHQIDEVPKTLNGKKMEVPIKQILAGVPVERAARLDAMANPSSIDAFVRLAGSTTREGFSPPDDSNPDGTSR